MTETKTKKKASNGTAPFGYEWRNGQLVQKPDEAKVYALLFDLFVQHQRIRTVGRILTDQGFRTRTGSGFSYSTVKRLLTNSAAKGSMKINRRSGEDGEESGEKHREIFFEPIVSEKDWNHVQSILARNAVSQSRKPAQYVLAGKTRCQCGSKMYVPTRSKYYSCTNCDTKISVDDLHHIFHEKLRDLDLPAGNELDRRQQSAKSEIASPEKIQREMEKLHELKKRGYISDDAFRTRKADVEQQLLSTKQNSFPAMTSEKLYSAWSTLNYDQQLQLVEATTHSIVVSKNSLTFHFYSFS